MTTQQRPALGRALTWMGWTAGVAGLAMMFSGSLLFKVLFAEPADDVARLPWWIRLIIMLGVVGTGGLFFYGSFRLVARGKQHLRPIVTSFEQLAGERYLLYLRPFTLDPVMALPPPDAPGPLFRSPFELPGLTVEEFLVRHFVPLGRIVAIGRPGESLPRLGAERGYLPFDDWQAPVRELIGGAQTVMLSAVPGPGTVWEFTEAFRIIPLSRLILLVWGEPATYDAFREAVEEEHAARSGANSGVAAERPLPPALPDIPPPTNHAKGLPWDFPLKGIVSFDDDGRAMFARFDLAVPRVRSVWTVRRLVRRELEPLLRRLSQLPSQPHVAARPLHRPRLRGVLRRTSGD